MLTTTQQHQFYRPLDNDITYDIKERVQVKVKRMLRDKILDDNTKRFLIQSNSKHGRFYILPKIHNPGRPIVSINSNPSERISQFVDHHLKIHSTHKRYFVNKLKHLRQLPENAFLVTLDVSSLCTNITHNEGIRDKDQCLLHSSCHSIHNKRAIPFSLPLRLRRICSTNETFTLTSNELIDYLYKRGYNRYFIQREIQRFNNITRTEALTPHDTSILDKPERVPFVITYNPALRSISSSIRKHFHILISSPRCYNVFKAVPIVDYRRSSNLRDFLVRAKLRNLTQHNQPRGSYPCGKNCLTGKYISDGQTSYILLYRRNQTYNSSHLINKYFSGYVEMKFRPAISLAYNKSKSSLIAYELLNSKELFTFQTVNVNQVEIMAKKVLWSFCSKC
ncbi:unnamed protein product, partial [Porites evermanni]